MRQEPTLFSLLGRARRACVVLIALGAISGCRAAADDLSAEEAVDAVVSAHAEGALLASSTDGLSTSTSMTADAAAKNAADKAASIYGGTCVTASASGAVTTYTLKECTGKFGLAQVSGTLTVAFAVATDGLHVRAMANGLAVGAASVDVDAEGVYSAKGATQNLAVTTSGAGSGTHADRFQRKGAYDLAWDDASGCLTLSGAFTTKILGATASTEATDYARCAQRCPSPGGHIHHVDAGGVTIDVTLDGSANAAWSSSRKHTGDVGLDCTP